LAPKKITIILIPEGTKKIRQIRLPRVLPLLLILALIASFSYFFCTLRDYRDIKCRIPRLAILEDENRHKQDQIAHLTERINSLARQVGDLNDFDHRLRTMVNLEKEDMEGQFQGIGGSDPLIMDPKSAIKESHQEVVDKMHGALDEIEINVVHGKQTKEDLFEFLESQKILLASTPSIWPTKGWLSSRFGPRKSPFTGRKEFHKGIDISTRRGAPIISPADGIISFVGSDRGYGRVVVISHGYGLKTKYAHLKKALVKKGQHVKRGETVALVGSTGRSTGPHLHYEVHLNNVQVDPLRYILN